MGDASVAHRIVTFLLVFVLSRRCAQRGLADGEAPEPLGELELLPEPPVVPLAPLEPVAPEVPDGPPAPELLPAAPLPLPEPAAWAMTSAGVSNMMETSKRARKCFM